MDVLGLADSVELRAMREVYIPDRSRRRMKSTIEMVVRCNDQEEYKRLFCRWPDQRTSDRRFWGTTILNTVLT